jgi:hypothetical protein
MSSSKGLLCNIQMGAAWRKTARHGYRRATHGGKRQLMGDLAKKPPHPAFMCCHLAYIVNLNRVRVPAPRATPAIITYTSIHRSTCPSPSPASAWSGFARSLDYRNIDNSLFLVKKLVGKRSNRRWTEMILQSSKLRFT